MKRVACSPPGRDVRLGNAHLDTPGQTLQRLEEAALEARPTLLNGYPRP